MSTNGSSDEDRQAVERLVEQLRARLAPVPDVVFALLFGSRSRPRARPDSDLDVALYVDDGLDARQRFERRLAATSALSGSVRPMS